MPIRNPGFMAAKTHSPEVKEKVRHLLEVEAKTITEASKETGVPKQTISEWAKLEEWKLTEVVRQVRIQEHRIQIDPATEAAMQRIRALPKRIREEEAEEKRHTLGCCIIEMLSHLPPNELLKNADKVKKLVDAADVLTGRKEKGSTPAAAISIGVLSNKPLPQQVQDVMQIADAHVVAEE